LWGKIFKFFFSLRKEEKFCSRTSRTKERKKKSDYIYDTHRLANVKQRTRLESWKKIGDGNR
jgi:hypothetical protein